MQALGTDFIRSPDRPLHEQVREHLREQCEKASVATALPPLRQLSKTLGVNHLTITRALRDLEEEGVVQVIPGKGAFVARPESSAGGVELLTIVTPTPSLLETARHILTGMQSGLKDNVAISGSTVVAPPVPNVEDFLRGLKARDVSAVAAFGFGYLPYPDSFLEAQFLHEVAKQVPVVLVGKEHTLLKLDCVYCDPAPQMQTYLQECHDSGLRRFEYLGANDKQTHLNHRLAAFSAFLLAHGIAWQHPTVFDSSTREIHYLLDRKPEVIIVAEPYRAHQLVVEAQQRGLQPGSDLHVLCFAGSTDEVRAIAPYVSVIVLEEEEVGRCVINRLNNRLDGTDKPPPIVRRVPGRLLRQKEFHPDSGA